MNGWKEAAINVLSEMLMLLMGIKEYAIEKVKTIPATLFIIGGTVGIVFCADQLCGVISPTACSAWGGAFTVVLVLGMLSEYFNMIDEIRYKKRHKRPRK